MLVLASGTVDLEAGSTALAKFKPHRALEHLEKVGVDIIGERVGCLTGWLLENLLSLQHSNGKPMIRIYGPTNTDMRGGTVTLNFYGPDERLLDYRRIEELANKEGISLVSRGFVTS